MDLYVVKYCRLLTAIYELPATLIYNNVTTHTFTIFIIYFQANN